MQDFGFGERHLIQLGTVILLSVPQIPDPKSGFHPLGCPLSGHERLLWK